MAKKKKEEVVEKAAEQPKVDNKVEKIKVKKQKMKKFSNDTGGNVVKVNLSESAVEEQQEETITKVDLSKSTEEPVKEAKTKTETPAVEKPVVEEVVEEKAEEKTQEPVATLEEVEEKVEEEKIDEIAEKVEEAITESIETGKDLPGEVQKLVDFMDETGGDLNDYVKLNQDYSELDNLTLLEEYYKQTKPHLNSEEINFIMEDQFSYDEDIDDEKDIKRKKLALKEQVAGAKEHLDGLKSKYYEDIKSGSKLTSEQQKAIDFFNRYNKEEADNQKGAELRKSTFTNKTEQVFNDKFKGFEYNVGEKKYRFNVNDVKSIKESQSDIGNFVGKFLDKNNTMQDAEGYHKSLFTAMNSDAIAKHFYEQGKSDAIKQSVEKGKNISMEPRQAHGEIEAGGIKVRVLGDDTADFKFKIKQK